MSRGRNRVPAVFDRSGAARGVASAAAALTQTDIGAVLAVTMIWQGLFTGCIRPCRSLTVYEALSFLRHGRLLFPTLLMNELRLQVLQAPDHCYIAPRNGHISLHTSASLGELFARLGWTVRSFTANLHMAEH